MTTNLLRPACDCVDAIDRGMADCHTVVQTALLTGCVIVATFSSNLRLRPSPLVVVASFCPFCGLKYVRAGLGAGAEIARARASTGEARRAG